MKNHAESEQSPQGILWLKLDGASKGELQKAYPPRYPNIFYDHVTLIFGAHQEAVNHMIGKNALAHVLVHAYNDRVEAVRVNTHGLPDMYGVPHITLSAQEGVEPFESVAMLQSEHHEEPVDPPVELDGTIEFIPFEPA